MRLAHVSRVGGDAPTNDVHETPDWSQATRATAANGQPDQSTIMRAGVDWNARQGRQGKETWLTPELLTISRISTLSGVSAYETEGAG